MIRLNRAGREHAIIEAIRALDARGNYRMHTRGEICRKMGIKSTSRIRDILDQMAFRGQLVGATTALDSFNHEIAIFGIPVYKQTSLPEDRVIIINGISCRVAEWVGVK